MEQHSRRKAGSECSTPSNRQIVLVAREKGNDLKKQANRCGWHLTYIFCILAAFTLWLAGGSATLTGLDELAWLQGCTLRLGYKLFSHQVMVQLTMYAGRLRLNSVILVRKSPLCYAYLLSSPHQSPTFSTWMYFLTLKFMYMWNIMYSWWSLSMRFWRVLSFTCQDWNQYDKCKISQ